MDNRLELLIQRYEHRVIACFTNPQLNYENTLGPYFSLTIFSRAALLLLE